MTLAEFVLFIPLIVHVLDIINMCWYSTHKPVPQVAKEDIAVYKHVVLIKKRPWPWSFHEGIVGAKSDLYNFLYTPYERNETIILIPYKRSDMAVWKIAKGYHSVLTPDTLIDLYLKPNVKFIIPKGSFYYVNHHNEVVSSDIVMTSELVNQ